jgi:hypothetical protein
LENKLFKIIIKFSTQLYIGWVLFIALLTLLPAKALPFQLDWNFLSLDKVGHFSIFTIMAFLGSASFNIKLKLPKAYKAVIISFIIAALYGSIIEYTQTFIPDRGFDYADLIANIGGAITGIGLFLILNSKATK